MPEPLKEVNGSPVLPFLRRVCDTLSAGAHALGAAIDRRKQALPRLGLILAGDELGTELEELFAAIWAGALGLWLLLPFHSFANVRAFAVLNIISYEWMWGVPLVVFAAWRFDAILLNRLCPRHNASLIGVGVWSSLAMFLLFGNVASPGGPFYLILAALEALSYRNLRTEGE